MIACALLNSTQSFNVLSNFILLFPNFGRPHRRSGGGFGSLCQLVRPNALRPTPTQSVSSRKSPDGGAIAWVSSSAREKNKELKAPLLSFFLILHSWVKPNSRFTSFMLANSVGSGWASIFFQIDGVDHFNVEKKCGAESVISYWVSYFLMSGYFRRIVVCKFT